MMFLRLLLVAGIVALRTPASEAEWKPSRPVLLIAPAEGGTVDLVARPLAPHLQQALGVPVVIGPRPRVGGSLGTNLAAKSAPNGSTILVALLGDTAPGKDHP